MTGIADALATALVPPVDGASYDELARRVADLEAQRQAVLAAITVARGDRRITSSAARMLRRALGADE